MNMIGIDLHQRESQLCIMDAAGGVTETRIVTSHERFAAVLSSHAPARALLEASTESEWVTAHLESLGIDVVVADPNYAPMYATRSRRVKTDRRHVRAELAVREALVRARTRFINVAKALVRRDGLRARSGTAERVAMRIRELPLAPALDAELAPLFALLEPLNAQIAAADARIAQRVKSDPAVALLATAPDIGAITASAVVAVADDITRFDSAHQFDAYLGLVPGERSSGEKRQVGHITKTGNRRVRYLLVEAAWRIGRGERDAFYGRP